ncbi:MAG: tRNA (adenosine(37)-N6)-threonylcarbamoyltransferase complex dimerization subunit type 1 TsaB [Pseudomonadota bacterium]
MVREAEPEGSAPVTLGFDCSGPWVAVALLSGGEVTTDIVEMARGQGEALMPMLEELLTAHGLGYGDIQRIAVGTGPGNFTGLRLATSAARGLSLGLQVPALGIGALDALAEAGAENVAMPAPREQSYRIVEGQISLEPRPSDSPDLTKLMSGIVTLGARASLPAPRPAPIYLRPADAAPPRDAPPVLID